MCELETLITYLPAMVTALIIAPLGAYVRYRLKNLASKEDFGSALEQLRRSTQAVERIKTELSEKHWVTQQIWETKRSAYEELITSLYLANKYLYKIQSYFSDYAECFIYIGPYSSGPYELPDEEEYCRSYEEYIESEQKAFKDKYENPESLKHTNYLLESAKESIVSLEEVFSLKSIYLHPDLKLIRDKVIKLKQDLFESNISQEEYEGNSDYVERRLSHYSGCEKSILSLIEETKELAAKDLKLQLKIEEN